MVVDDSRVSAVAVLPQEADTPLIIDPAAVLASTIALQCFETVRGRDPQVFEPVRRVDDAQLSSRYRLDLGRKAR